eukprot:1159664-Pelagomonas_calceolata.AAC.6
MSEEESGVHKLFGHEVASERVSNSTREPAMISSLCATDTPLDSLYRPLLSVMYPAASKGGCSGIGPCLAEENTGTPS